MSSVYREVRFYTNQDLNLKDILIAGLADIGFESFMDHETGFSAYVAEKEFDELLFNDLVNTFDAIDFESIIHPPVNWNQEWEKNFSPVRVHENLWITAPFHTRVSDEKMEIIIEPRMSFGTGHHATTMLMCKIIDAMNIRGFRVLDFGCGTGVLGILAMKKGSAHVTAIDIEPWATENAEENARRNQVSLHLFTGDSSLFKQMLPFDVIFANINRNILISDAENYLLLLNSGGYLLISGFLESDLGYMESFFVNKGLTVVQMDKIENWACILFQKV